MDLELTVFPLLFVGSAASYMALAVPAGRLADRVGRERVFVAGYGLLLVVYGALLLHGLAVPALIACLVCLGGFYAATDGVLAAAASAVLPDGQRGGGLGLLLGVTTLAKLAAALLFGLLWSTAGLTTATVVFGCALALTTTVALILVAGRRFGVGHA
jgi:MFS family permease